MATTNNDQATKIYNNLRRGTFEITLLSVLELEDQYGYQLSRNLKTLSEGQYVVNEATMYPTLYRLLKNGYLESRKLKVVGERFRVYYRLTKAGKEYLALEREQYSRFRDSMDLFLKNVDSQKN